MCSSQPELMVQHFEPQSMFITNMKGFIVHGCSVMFEISEGRDVRVRDNCIYTIDLMSLTMSRS